MAKKTRKISLRVSDIEYGILREKAKKIDRPLSYLIRKVVLDKQITSKCDIEMVFELKKIGTNLNQIAKWLNTNRHFIDENSGEMITITNVINKVYSLISLIYDR